MKYFKNTNNEVFAFNADGSQDAYIKPDMVALTQSEADAHINPPLTPAQITEQHNAPIIAQLNALDIKRIRPLAEGDAAYLADLNAQIVTLRGQLV